MATRFNDTVQFIGQSNVASVSGYGGMSAVGGVFNYYENFSLSQMTAANVKYSLAANEATAANIAGVVAALISVLYRKGILPANGSGF